MTDHAEATPGARRKPWSVGLVVAGAAAPIEGVKEGLAELGLIEGRDVAYTLLAANGELDRLPGFCAELVAAKVDVIALIGAVTARAARAATTEIPIVFAVVVDPVEDGLAIDLLRPDGNLTGVTTFDPDQARVQMAFLRAVNPALSRVAILGDGGVSMCLSNANQAAASDLGLIPQLIRVKAPNADFPAAFASIAAGQAEALVVLEEPITQAARMEIAALARDAGLPTVFARGQADAGGLIAYGTDLREATRAMARYVARILKEGAGPGDLPIVTGLKQELVINLATARHLGVTVPPELLAKADRVIE